MVKQKEVGLGIAEKKAPPSNTSTQPASPGLLLGMPGPPTRLPSDSFWNPREPDTQGTACFFGKLSMAGSLPQPQKQIHLDSKKRDSPCFLQNSADS